MIIFIYLKIAQIPSFLNNNDVIKFYESIFPFNKSAKSDEFIYISRRNANWRNIINETDFISTY